MLYHVLIYLAKDLIVLRSAPFILFKRMAAAEMLSITRVYVGNDQKNDF